MFKRTLIYIGVVLGAIGTAGGALMLITGAKGANVAVLIVWVVVLLVSIYFMKKNIKIDHS